MSDDKMRAEFEAWATPYELDLRRLNEGYLSNASNNCWIVWQAAYAAGQKAEQAEVERLRAELAEAKAASVLPVKVLNIWEGTYQSDRYIELRTDAEADTFTDWLRARMKERGEG
jgi:hypothetical protein